MGIGTLATVVIQSSSAVTVIALGFVSAGIMSLTQAATVIYGANIGTTITGQIVAWGISGGGGVSTTVIFSALTGLGASSSHSPRTIESRPSAASLRPGSPVRGSP